MGAIILDLVKSSVITQGIITIVVLAVDCALILQGRAVPQELWAVTFAVVGFYFGSKVGIAQGQSTIQSNKE
jgi:hypothetical protein